MVEEVATTVHSNIRELEGALNKIMAFHQLKGNSPTVESVRTLLSGANAAASASVTPQKLLEAVAAFYALQVKDILGKNREKKLSVPRQIIMYLMREELKMSYPAIGDELGGRDHTTAMHAHTKISGEMETDQKIKRDLELIRQKIYLAGS